MDIKAFEAFPRVLQVGVGATVRLCPREPTGALPEGSLWRVTCQPMEGLPGATRHAPADVRVVRAAGNALALPLTLPAEQEYALQIEPDGAATTARMPSVRLYAVAPDWFALRPFKGDLHMHSRSSDGGEPPAYVAGACRRIGMDFMAVTDHRQYAPSLEAIAAFADTGSDLCIYPGEEVHSPDTPVHIISFGSRWSITEQFATPRYRDGVDALAASIGTLASGTDPRPYAACVWAFDEIRRAGGLGIFCHPCWVCRDRYDVPAGLTDLVFERQPFDAYELIGGYFPHEFESNHLQVVRYQAEIARGRALPVVGVSDAHGCERGQLFGWYYTLLLAKTAGLDDVIESVRGLRSVAVEHLPSTAPRAYGPFRLVRYAQFLLREVLPAHDALCGEEGRCMLAHIAGDGDAAARLQALKGQVARLYETLWA